MLCHGVLNFILAQWGLSLQMFASAHFELCTWQGRTCVCSWFEFDWCFADRPVALFPCCRYRLVVPRLAIVKSKGSIRSMGLTWPGYVRLLTVVLLDLRLHSMGILYLMGFYIMAKPDSLATVNVLCPEALERPIEDFSWVVVVCARDNSSLEASYSRSRVSVYVVQTSGLECIAVLLAPGSGHWTHWNYTQPLKHPPP